jgi:hypothetical protein
MLPFAFSASWAEVWSGFEEKGVKSVHLGSAFAIHIVAQAKLYLIQ